MLKKCISILCFCWFIRCDGVGEEIFFREEQDLDQGSIQTQFNSAFSYSCPCLPLFSLFSELADLMIQPLSEEELARWIILAQIVDDYLILAKKRGMTYEEIMSWYVSWVIQKCRKGRMSLFDRQCALYLAQRVQYYIKGYPATKFNSRHLTLSAWETQMTKLSIDVAEQMMSLLEKMRHPRWTHVRRTFKAWKSFLNRWMPPARPNKQLPAPARELKVLRTLLPYKNLIFKLDELAVIGMKENPSGYLKMALKVLNRAGMISKEASKKMRLEEKKAMHFMIRLVRHLRGTKGYEEVREGMDQELITAMGLLGLQIENVEGHPLIMTFEDNLWFRHRVMGALLSEEVQAIRKQLIKHPLSTDNQGEMLNEEMAIARSTEPIESGAQIVLYGLAQETSLQAIEHRVSSLGKRVRQVRNQAHYAHRLIALSLGDGDDLKEAVELLRYTPVKSTLYRMMRDTRLSIWYDSLACVIEMMSAEEAAGLIVEEVMAEEDAQDQAMSLRWYANLLGAMRHEKTVAVLEIMLLDEEKSDSASIQIATILMEVGYHQMYESNAMIVIWETLHEMHPDRIMNWDEYFEQSQKERKILKGQGLLQKLKKEWQDTMTHERVAYETLRTDVSRLLTILSTHSAGVSERAMQRISDLVLLGQNGYTAYEIILRLQPYPDLIPELFKRQTPEVMAIFLTEVAQADEEDQGRYAWLLRIINPKILGEDYVRKVIHEMLFNENYRRAGSHQALQKIFAIGTTKEPELLDHVYKIVQISSGRETPFAIHAEQFFCPYEIIVTSGVFLLRDLVGELRQEAIRGAIDTLKQYRKTVSDLKKKGINMGDTTGVYKNQRVLAAIQTLSEVRVGTQEEDHKKDLKELAFFTHGTWDVPIKAVARQAFLRIHHPQAEVVIAQEYRRCKKIADGYSRSSGDKSYDELEEIENFLVKLTLRSEFVEKEVMKVLEGWFGDEKEKFKKEADGRHYKYMLALCRRRYPGNNEFIGEHVRLIGYVGDVSVYVRRERELTGTKIPANERATEQRGFVREYDSCVVETVKAFEYYPLQWWQDVMDMVKPGDGESMDKKNFTALLSTLTKLAKICKERPERWNEIIDWARQVDSRELPKMSSYMLSLANELWGQLEYGQEMMNLIKEMSMRGWSPEDIWALFKFKGNEHDQSDGKGLLKYMIEKGIQFSPLMSSVLKRALKFVKSSSEIREMLDFVHFMVERTAKSGRHQVDLSYLTPVFEALSGKPHGLGDVDDVTRRMFERGLDPKEFLSQIPRMIETLKNRSEDEWRDVMELAKQMVEKGVDPGNMMAQISALMDSCPHLIFWKDAMSTVKQLIDQTRDLEGQNQTLLTVKPTPSNRASHVPPEIWQDVISLAKQMIAKGMDTGKLMDKIPSLIERSMWLALRKNFVQWNNAMDLVKYAMDLVRQMFEKGMDAQTIEQEIHILVKIYETSEYDLRLEKMWGHDSARNNDEFQRRWLMGERIREKGLDFKNIMSQMSLMYTTLIERAGCWRDVADLMHRMVRKVMVAPSGKLSRISFVMSELEKRSEHRHDMVIFTQQMEDQGMDDLYKLPLFKAWKNMVDLVRRMIDLDMNPSDRLLSLIHDLAWELGEDWWNDVMELAKQMVEWKIDPEGFLSQLPSVSHELFHYDFTEPYKIFMNPLGYGPLTSENRFKYWRETYNKRLELWRDVMNLAKQMVAKGIDPKGTLAQISSVLQIFEYKPEFWRDESDFEKRMVTQGIVRESGVLVQTPAVVEIFNKRLELWLEKFNKRLELWRDVMDSAKQMVEKGLDPSDMLSKIPNIVKVSSGHADELKKKLVEMTQEYLKVFLLTGEHRQKEFFDQAA